MSSPVIKRNETQVGNNSGARRGAARRDPAGRVGLRAGESVPGKASREERAHPSWLLADASDYDTDVVVRGESRGDSRTESPGGKL